MSKLEFCPCTDTGCQFNPANHDQGCDPLRGGQPQVRGDTQMFFSCKVVDSVDGFDDWSFQHFAKLALKQ